MERLHSSFRSLLRGLLEFICHWANYGTGSRLTYISSDAIPFLVVTVGFEKPFLLAKSVMESVANAKPSEHIRPLIADGVSRVGPALISDCAFEVTALILAYVSGMLAVVE